MEEQGLHVGGREGGRESEGERERERGAMEDDRAYAWRRGNGVASDLYREVGTERYLAMRRRGRVNTYLCLLCCHHPPQIDKVVRERFMMCISHDLWLWVLVILHTHC